MNTNLQSGIQGFFDGLLMAYTLQNESLQGKTIEQLAPFIKEKMANADAEMVTELNETQEKVIEILENAHINIEAAIEELYDVTETCAYTAEYKEMFFDFLMVHILSNHQFSDDYLESPEWLAIEENTLDRGTEALNVFIYLQEAIDEDIDISLNDFLDEFLMVEDDDFQEELEIYEPLVLNRDIIDSPFAVVVKEGMRIAQQSEISDIFVPLVCFFKAARKPDICLHSMLKADQDALDYLPLTACLLGFYNDKKVV
jgi:hypothetical protein